MTDSDEPGSNRQFEPPHTTLGKYCPSCHRIYVAPESDANFCAKDGAPLVANQRIFGDKYVLGEPLGFGHMSEVYVAIQAGIGRNVALKLLRSEHETSPEMRKRFEREAQIASSLDHPNAVTIFESGHTSDGQSYIAMELLSGETLDRVIQREAPMPVGRALELLIPAVRALAAAHSRNIIHRESTPPSIPSRNENRTELGKRCEKPAGRSTNCRLQSSTFLEWTHRSVLGAGVTSSG
jgi:serine/threonine protein kinase